MQGRDRILPQGIAKLDLAHDSTAFDCGSDALDRFIKLYALQGQRVGMSQTYVAIKEKTIVGYHTLVVGSVVHEDAPDRFRVVQEVPTRRGARTLELDEGTRRIYTVTADFGPAPPATEEHPHPRPSIIPGTFVLLVLEP